MTGCHLAAGFFMAGGWKWAMGHPHLPQDRCIWSGAVRRQRHRCSILV